MFSFCIPTEFVFGSGALKALHKYQLPGRKALIVTTNGKSVKRCGYLDELINQLQLSAVDYAVFDEITPNPTTDNIMAAAAAAKEAECDFVIGFGGGSPMDSAKLIALAATNPGNIWEYCQKGSGGRKQPAYPPLPVVCISTTAGTGSEADNSGMVTNPETKEKLGIGFQSLFPAISVVDPELMVSVPPRLTAYQGLDTFFHLAEGYLSKKANPFNEMFSITGIEKIGSFLPRAIKDGRDIEARENVAFANTLGGLVMSTGKLLSQHALEHALSAYYPNLPHGAGLILICRAYFGFFIEKGLCSQKFIDMAKALGFENANEPKDFLKALEKLLKDCGVAGITMSEFGIEEAKLPQMAVEVRSTLEQAFECDPTVLTADDCVKIYKESYR